MSVKCNHEGLVKWVEEMAAMCKPDQIYWCDGSKEEFDRMMSLMVENGSAIPLKKRPESFLFRSSPSDVARIESRTYLSTVSEEDGVRADVGC